MAEEKPGVQTQVESPDQKPSTTDRGLVEGAGVGTPAGGAPTSRLYVVLGLNDAQRTKALAKGMIKDNLSSLKLYLSQDVVKLLDPARVRVTEGGRLIILDQIERENEHDLSKEPRIYLAEYGLITGILSDLTDYIIDNGKTTFDADCLRYLYKLQDEAIERVRNEIEKVRESIRRSREMERRKEEARELLKKEIEEYERTIAELKEKVSNLESRLAELNDIIEDYAEFIKTQDLDDEFVSFVADKRSKDKESEIREKYMLE